MRIKFLLLICVCVIIVSCKQKSQNAQDRFIEIQELLNIADQHLDQELTIAGTVNHVCSHSGRRCFLVDSTGEYTVRVEAMGSIESFGKELIGSKIEVTGILKETRLTANEITDWEIELIVKNPQEEENVGENCSAEMANINKMREWMKANNKDYYAIYYIEGLNYELVE